MIRNLLAALLVPAPAGPRYSHNVVRQVPVPTTKPLSQAQVWKTDAAYTDPQHGVTFRYPSTWKAETQFGFHAPALTDSDQQPIAGFGYEEPDNSQHPDATGPYSGTNLEGFGIVYSAASAVNANECDARAAKVGDAPKHRTVMFYGRSFAEYETGEAGMSQSNDGNLYATYVQPFCYLFETDEATVSPSAMDVPKALSSAQEHFIHAHLLDIMKSVRILLR
jgi:hypothetical protein